MDSAGDTDLSFAAATATNAWVSAAVAAATAAAVLPAAAIPSTVRAPNVSDTFSTARDAKCAEPGAYERQLHAAFWTETVRVDQMKDLSNAKEECVRLPDRQELLRSE